MGFELVGFQSSSSGRLCPRHECCGKEVKVGDVLRLKSCEGGDGEPAVQALKLVDGCCYAYLPRYMLPNQHLYVDKFVVVTQLYWDSENLSRRRYSFRNAGVASCDFLGA